MKNTNISKEDVAAKLKALREKRGESQTQVAEAIGVPVSTYNAYERGENTPRPEIMAKIANHFDRTVQFIFFQKPTH